MVRVVVVEDDLDIRDLIQMRLELSRHQVTVAKDAAEGLQLCLDVRPDVLVMDVMPDHAGLRALHLVRTSPRYAALRKLPVVLLSGLASEEAVSRGYRAGADAYLVKPFSPRELVAVVESLWPPSVARS